MAIPNNGHTTASLSTGGGDADNNRGSVANDQADMSSLTSGNAVENKTNIKALVRANYDIIAARYLIWAISFPSPRLEFLQKVMERLQTRALATNFTKPKPRVLELGCGAGVPATQLMVRSGYAVIANDISAAQMQLAREHVVVSPTSDESEQNECGSVEFVHADMMNLDYPSDSFDAVVGLYSIFHLPRDEQEVLIGRIYRWLKQGGYLLMNVGAMDESGSIQEDFLGEDMYWSWFPEKVYREIVTREGFVVVETEVRVEVEDGREVHFMWILGRK
ncbi:hypothetical protein ACJ72_04834 [Emergomyces africanus]|uniref:Methyltransferase type 11 domain-containing protein n=1 Tax=Emergomyces africanus TaxID=1955775 RepID=A0A1B7NVL2_9EURO|nr:hypothetical protein ACJ72_04834 [Emergomyces africanus]